MKIVKFNVKFDGLYFWGSGWAENVAKIWDDYWQHLDSCFWRVLMDDEWTKTTFIVGVGGGAMIHPMGFDLLFKQIGSSYKWVGGKQIETFNELDELAEHCRKVAELCGGTCEVSPFEVVEI